MNKILLQKQVQKLIQKLNQPQQFIIELEALLESLHDEKATAEYKRTIPNISKFFGVYSPALDIIAQEISKFGLKEHKATLGLCQVIWKRGFAEERTIVAKTLTKIGQIAPNESLKLIKSFLKDINNWAVCDTLATQGIRGIISTHQDKIFDLALNCIKSKNKWIQRFGVVTIIELTHNKKLEITKKVFEIIAPLMTTEDSDLKKAVAWTLREISKREPRMVKDFLSNYQNSQDKNTSWIVREGSKKL